MTATAWLIIVLVAMFLTALYFTVHIFIVQENEQGVLCRWGVAKKVLNPGTYLRLGIAVKVIKYEKTPLILESVVYEATTKNGKVKNYKDDSVETERSKMDIFFSFTTFFSEGNNLLKTAKNAPRNIGEMMDVIDLYLTNVLIKVASGIPWVLLDQDGDKISDYILAKIIPGYEYYELIVENEEKPKEPNIYSFNDTKNKTGNSLLEMEKYNPLVQFGLDMSRTSLSIQRFRFSDEELRKSFGDAEKSRLQGEGVRLTSIVKADAAREEGKAKADVTKMDGIAQANVIKVTGVAKADARALMISKIKDNPDLEYLRTLEEMAKGTSNTILYELPEAIRGKISGMLGGGKAEDVFGFLKDEKVITAIKEAIEKLIKKEE